MKRWIVGSCVLLALVAVPAWATPDEDLRNVRRAITQTENRLKQQQQRQQNLQGDIRRMQTELATIRRELQRISQQRQTTQATLTQLQNRLEALQIRISGTQAQAARLLENRYRNRQENSITLFLQNTDPQEKGRHLAYMRYLNRSNEAALRQLAADRETVRQQEAEVQQQLQQLAALKRQQEQALARLGRQEQQLVRQNLDLDAGIRRDDTRLSQLRRNEQRLNGVVAQITRRAAERRAQQAAERRRQQEAQRAARAAQAQNQARPTAPDAVNPPSGGLTAEDLALQEQNHAANEETGRFGRLQGRLSRPVSGSLAGSFGQPRPNGGTWRGMFIQTPPAAVRSVAAGEVAYAAPLQGYGNTVIIDHGDGYLSIYTGLSSVAAGTGTKVAAGQGIGQSGQVAGVGDGLYFEIRYRNQAMNPQSWVN